MTRGQAEQWIIASAAITGGVYAYLRLRGSHTTPIARFSTAWGVVYVSLSVMALAAPGVAAGFAILVLTADVLANVPTLAAEIAKVEGRPAPKIAPVKR